MSLVKFLREVNFQKVEYLLEPASTGLSAILALPTPIESVRSKLTLIMGIIFRSLLDDILVEA